MDRKSYQKIWGYCERHHLITEGDKILIGLSGGADSVYLLNFLVKLREKYPLQLYAVHVNHGIRGTEAEEDEAFAEKYAKKLQVDFEAVSLDIPGLAAEQGMTEEEAGRYYRYRSFRQIMEREGCHKIAVGHHRDDQAETLLFQLIRGSGLRGLGAMRPCHDGIIRPLLQISRKQIESELRVEGICWQEDSSNQDSLYARNKIRRQLIPYLQKELQPEVVEHLAGTAEQVQEVWNYFYRQIQTEYTALVQKKSAGLSFARDAFLQLDPALRPYILLEFMAEAAGSRKDIGRVHVQNMMNLIQGETGKRISLPYHLQAGRDYEEIWIARKKVMGQGTAFHESSERHISDRSDTDEEQPPWQIEKQIYLRSELPEGIMKNHCTKSFDYARIKNNLVWRHPLPGDRMVIDVQGHTKKLSRMMLDAKVPREKRKQLWILTEGEQVLWAPELQRSSMRYYVTDETEQVLVVSIMEKGGNSCERDYSQNVFRGSDCKQSSRAGRGN